MNGGGAGATMADLFARLAADLDSASAHHLDDVIEYRRDDVAFAITDGRAIELRLDPDVAEAVEATPNVSASRRGGGWIRFAPPTVDQFVLDRAEAWFLSAWRAAES